MDHAATMLIMQLYTLCFEKPRNEEQPNWEEKTCFMDTEQLMVRRRSPTHLPLGEQVEKISSNKKHTLQLERDLHSLTAAHRTPTVLKTPG